MGCGAKRVSDGRAGPVCPAVCGRGAGRRHTHGCRPTGVVALGVRPPTGDGKRADRVVHPDGEVAGVLRGCGAGRRHTWVPPYRGGALGVRPLRREGAKRGGASPLPFGVTACRPRRPARSPGSPRCGPGPPAGPAPGRWASWPAGADRIPRRPAGSCPRRRDRAFCRSRDR